MIGVKREIRRVHNRRIGFRDREEIEGLDI